MADLVVINDAFCEDVHNTAAMMHMMHHMRVLCFSASFDAFRYFQALVKSIYYVAPVRTVIRQKYHSGYHYVLYKNGPYISVRGGTLFAAATLIV